MPASLLISITTTLLLIAVFSAEGADLVPDSAWRVRMDGFGPIRIGMTRVQAERAAGMALSDDRELRLAYCYYLDFTRGFKGVIFMVTEGRIARENSPR